MTYTLKDKELIRNISEMILGNLTFFKSTLKKEELLKLYPEMDEFLEYAYSKECSRSTVRNEISKIKDSTIRVIFEQAAESIYDIKFARVLSDLKDDLNNVQAQVRKLNEALRGRTVVINSNYNGQQHGNSKKSLKGTTATIRRFYADTDANGDYYFALFLEEHLVGIRWKDVELVPE